MKLNRTYYVGFAGLDIYGLPDSSLGHDENTIGIILNWKLKLVGHSILEGKKEHIDHLITVINAYTSKCLSGISTTVSSKCKTVSITRQETSHILQLTSSKKNVEPLSINLDDAELADLTLCLEKLVFDKKVNVNWGSQLTNDCLRKNKSSKLSLKAANLLHLLIGVVLISVSSIFYLRIPNPKIDIPSQSIREEPKEFK